MQVTIDIGDITEPRMEAAVSELRKLKAWYEERGQKTIKAGTHTLEQVSALIQPLGDALHVCGMVSLCMAEEPEAATEEYSEIRAAARSVCKSVAKENAAEDRDVKTPLCRFCEQPGKRAGERKDFEGKVAERYYVCVTEGCIAQRTGVPQPVKLFSV